MRAGLVQRGRVGVWERKSGECIRGKGKEEWAEQKASRGPRRDALRSREPRSRKGKEKEGSLAPVAPATDGGNQVPDALLRHPTEELGPDPTRIEVLARGIHHAVRANESLGLQMAFPAA